MKAFATAWDAARGTIKSRRAFVSALLGSAAALVTGLLPRSAGAGGDCSCCLNHEACVHCWDINWEPDPTHCYCATWFRCDDCGQSGMVCHCEHVQDLGPGSCEQMQTCTTQYTCTRTTYVCTNTTFYAPCL